MNLCGLSQVTLDIVYFYLDLTDLVDLLVKQYSNTLFQLTFMQ